MASDLRTTDPPEAMAQKVSVNVPKVSMAVPDIPDLVIPSAPASKPSLKPSPAAAPRPPTNAVEDDFSFNDDNLAGGDLQIDLSGAATSKPGIARPPTPGVGFSPFDDDIAAGPSIELDTVGGAVPRHVSSGGMAAVSAVPAPASNRSLPTPASSQRSFDAYPPSPPAAAPAHVAVDPFEAKALGDYGPRPEAFWHTPLYAYRVMTRRSALRRELAGKREEAARTLKRVEDALVAFGERARALAKEGKSSVAQPALERVHAAEELLRSRDGALAGAMDAQSAAIAAIDARLAPAEAELARARSEEAVAQTTRDAADEDAKRADAKLKRLDIELRNGAVGRASERDALAAEIAQKAARRTETEQKLAEAHRVSSVAQAKVEAIAGERTAQEARFTRQAGTRSAGVDDAQTHLRTALVELGRAMLADPTSATDLARAREEIARLEEHAQDKSKHLALHESALTAYDAPQVFLGIVLVAIGLGLVVLLLFFPFIYRAFAT